MAKISMKKKLEKLVFLENNEPLTTSLRCTLGIIENRFWKKIIKTDNCWEWIGAKNNGYGLIRINGKNERAHRISWILAYGEIPKGMCILHHCDNPGCVNPDHLFIGTFKDNTQDCIRKGRIATGDRSGAHTHPESRPYGNRNGSRLHPELLPHGDQHWSHVYPERVLCGEKLPQTKLNKEQILQIRKIYTTGKISQEKLAKLFKVTRSNISFIVRCKTWTHI